MAQEWYVRVNGEDTGPLTLQELFVQCRTGQLEPDDLGRASGGYGKWRFVQKIDEVLFGSPAELEEAMEIVLRSPNPDLDECYWNEIFERIEESRSDFEGYSSSMSGDSSPSLNGGSSASLNDPNTAASHYGRGWKWLLKDGFDAAIREFTDAIRLDPKSAASFHARGTAWLKKGDLSSAVKDYDAAIRLDPIHAALSAYNIEDIFGALCELNEGNPTSPPSLKSLWPDCPPELSEVLQEKLKPVFDAEIVIASPEIECEVEMNQQELVQPHKGYRPVPSSSFVLTEKLGAGHFGAVWRAEHPTFGPSVFKFCMKTGQRWIKSLQNEMQKTYHLSHPVSHPGIVTLMGEHLSDSRIPCLHYEFVDGMDFRKVLLGESEKKKQFTPLKPDHAAAVILKLVEIMAYVHSRPKPVVHRDLKPANILVTNYRDLGVLTALDIECDLRLATFKVMDFGLAGHVRPEQEMDSESSIGAQFDGTGTTAYMSPQQKRHEPSHPSDDIFAIGVMWYELLIGKVEFGPPGVGEIERLQNDFELQGGTSEQWEVIVKCLDGHREHRIQNAEDLEKRIRAAYALEKPVDLFEQVTQARNAGQKCGKITSLSVEMARFLTKPPIFNIGFGLTSLTTDVALALAEGDIDTLYLDSLTSLTPEAALALAKGNWRRLYLTGLKTLKADVALALSKGNWDTLNLEGLRTIAPDAAICLSKGNWKNLILGNLKTLDPNAALALAEGDGKSISFFGMDTLAPDIAEALGKGKLKSLTLYPLETLTPDAALALAKGSWRGRLSLHGLRSLKPDVALGLAEGTWKYLHIPVGWLSSDTALALSKGKWENFDLDALDSESLTPDTALALAKGKWANLYLDGIDSLKLDVALALAKGIWGNLHFGILDKLPPDVALALAKESRANLHLGGLTALSPDAALGLTKGNYDELHLNGIETLKPDVALALAKGKWERLYLNGIKTLPADVALALAKGKCDELYLNGIKTLKPDVALALSQGRCDVLYLNGVKRIDDSAALALANSRGTVFDLSGLETISLAAFESFEKAANVLGKEIVIHGFERE